MYVCKITIAAIHSGIRLEKWPFSITTGRPTSTAIYMNIHRKKSKNSVAEKNAFKGSQILQLLYTDDLFVF